ncbi:glycosyltransferase [Marinospirillum sp.]|uniref:glycosyltransferase n=1 Tax=Marinospirillum sp. TaxID=2183934 RepID=UPI00384B08D1
MNVLYIAYAFPPVNIVASQRAMFQAKYMAEAGAKVTVISAEQTRKRDDYELLKILEDVPNLTVHRIMPWGRSDIKGKHGFKPSAKGWLWVLRTYKLAKKLHKNNNFDILLSTYGPKYPHLAAYFTSQATGLPWVAEYRDPWVGNEHQNRDTFVNRLIEKNIIKKSSALVTVSQGFASILKSVHGEIIPIYIVYNGYDEADKKFVDSYGAAIDTLRLIIAGTVYPIQKKGVNELLKGMVNNKNKVILEYYGPSEKLIRDIMTESGVDALVNFHGIVSKTAITRAISSADIAVLPASSGKGQLPVKFYDYLSVRKPVLMLGGSGSEIEKIMLETNSGMNAETADEVDDFLSNFENKSLEFNFTNSEYYTRAYQTDKLLGYLNNVLKLHRNSTNKIHC